MRIFYFPSFYPSERPNERWIGAFTHRQVKALQESSVDIKVVIPERGYPSWPVYYLSSDWRDAKMKSHGKYRRFDGIDIFHPVISNHKPSRLFNKPYRESYVEAVIIFLNQFRLDPGNDYFFAQWLPEAEYVVELGKKLGIRTAVLGIGDDILKIPHESEQHLASFIDCWKNADIRGVVADYLGKEANRLVNNNFDYTVFYSSVNFDEFHPICEKEKIAIRHRLNIPNDKIVILSVGSPIIRKGWLDLFDAIEKIEDKSSIVLLGIHGGTPEIDLDSEILQRNLSDNWINLGEISPSRIKLYYQAADIFCLPSHWEGLANALLEAMAVGLPVITTPVAGHPEIVQHGYNGLFVPPHDFLSLSKSIKLLIADSTMREILGRNATTSLKKKPGDHKSIALQIISAFSCRNAKSNYDI